MSDALDYLGRRPQAEANEAARRQIARWRLSVDSLRKNFGERGEAMAIILEQNANELEQELAQSNTACTRTGEDDLAETELSNDEMDPFFDII